MPTPSFDKGLKLHQQGQLEDAKAIYKAILSENSNHFDATHLLGVIAKQQGRFEEAVQLITLAIKINPTNPHALSNRGNALKELKRFQEAHADYQAAIALVPSFAQAHYNLGLVQQELKEFDQALKSYDRAIELKPDYAEAWCNKGAALQSLGLMDEAIKCYQQAIGFQPQYADAHCNLGVALLECKQFNASIASFTQAINIKPDFALAYFNRGVAYKELNQLNSAIADYTATARLDPQHAEAFWNASLALLTGGDYKNGLILYEWRWRRAGFAGLQRNFDKPLWLGKEPIAGKTILLHCEQGLGDAIQFVRYVGLLKSAQARIVLEAPASLMRLFQTLKDVDQLVMRGELLPEFDVHCPLLSLPLAFKTEINTIPLSGKYIDANQGKVSGWAARLGAKTKPRIGLIWSGSVGHQNDANRSISLKDLLPVLDNRFEYVCLQKEIRPSDLAFLESAPIQVLAQEIEDFEDTAALCELMDLIIGVDTSVAHLAGALGRPTWILLPFAPDWRWLLNRSNSPWYRSVKLYRQDDAREWGNVFNALRADLKNIA